jgi:hypothetical protein
VSKLLWSAVASVVQRIVCSTPKRSHCAACPTQRRVDGVIPGLDACRSWIDNLFCDLAAHPTPICDPTKLLMILQAYSAHFGGLKITGMALVDILGKIIAPIFAQLRHTDSNYHMA